uniref:phage tail protein n=1 Tax=Lysinibacillus sp. D4B1_S16 TaxID=2941231 RepID=UPI0037C62608
PMHYGNYIGLTTREFVKEVWVENVTLSNEQLPFHKQVLQGSSKTTGGDSSPEGAVWSAIGGFNPKKLYKEFTANTKVNIHQQAIGTTGGNLPHNNMVPYAALNLRYCLYGEY